MEELLEFLAVLAFVVLIVFIGIYVAQAIFLSKFNKLVNGKGTPMAWIPIANIYLLGKLTVNKIVGWILVICSFLTGTVTTTINGNETTHTILPEGLNSIVSTSYSISVIGLFIYAIVKYKRLKKINNSSMIQQSINNHVQQQTMQQPVNNQVQQQPISNEPINTNSTQN